MRVLRVDVRDRERIDLALANQVRAFLLAVGKWIEGHCWTLLLSEVTGQWSLDLEGQPVLTDVSLPEIAEAM
jgi:hypothetical protein